MKKIIFFFLFTISISFSEVYIPKNNQEKIFLNNLKKEKIVIGLLQSQLYNEIKINEKTVNDILKEIFIDYLELNVDFKVDTLENLYGDCKNGEIQGIGLINKEKSLIKYLDFTDTIYNEELYIMSDQKRINFLEDLDNGWIYSTPNNVHIGFMKEILENSDLSATFVQTRNLENYKKEFILTQSPFIYNFRYFLKISNSSGVVIGITNRFEELVPILNSAIKSKYEIILRKHMEDIKNYYILDNFYKSLTNSEKEYLSNLNSLNVFYEHKNNSIVSYYSEINNKYAGIFPNILNILGEKLNIKINDLTGKLENPTLELKNKNIDMLVLSKTSDRSEEFIFSDKIYGLNTYIVSLKNNIRNSQRIGIIPNSVEEQIIKKYDVDKNIKKYKNYDSMLASLNNGELKSIVTININNLDSRIYNTNFFETIPVNMAFNKDDQILRNIFNKGIISLIDKDKISDSAILEKENEERELLRKSNNQKSVLIIVIALFIILILFLLMKYKSDRRLQKELLKDPLSGLPNRIVFNKFCKNIANNLKGYVFILDLDDFKEINDNYGHESGDEVIAEISKYLREHFKEDYIFRISGDEIYGMFLKDIKKIMDGISKYKENNPIFLKYDVNFSLGLYYKKVGENINSAFRYADMAMFDAKKRKGFSFRIADNYFIEKKEKEEKIISLLKGNIEDIYPVFQPKMKVSSEKITGGEVLARCRSIELGDISPAIFIPIAEEHNLIYKIDYKMAEEAIKFVRKWIDNKKIKKGFRISFNLSVKTFGRKDLVEQITNILEKYKVSGEYVEIEITETILIREMKDIVGKLSSLINLGIQISLDDFTAGHSTAGFLSLLPIKIVKFDKSLLDSITKSEEKGKIVYINLISLVKDLKLKIVSEGVETLEQIDFLREHKVDYIQGYLVGKPKEDIEEDFFEVCCKI